MVIKDCVRCGDPMTRVDGSRPRWACRPCQNESSRRYKLNNPDKVVESRRRYREKNPRLTTMYRESDPKASRRADDLWKFGIDAEESDRLRSIEACQICGGVNSSGRALSIDHDHSCCSGQKSCGKCIRGVLCSNCNNAMGLLKDDPERIRSMLKYLTGNGEVW